MANWAIPQLSDLKVDVLNQLKLRDVDSYTMAELPTNPPVGAKRWNTSLSKFESWNGSAWVAMVIFIAGGGTGATDINGFLGNFGLGSMALQNSNAVNIIGGSITGLSNLGSSGNITALGVYVAGSASWTLTNSGGQLREVAIDNIANIAHINANEIISGAWTFNANITVAGVITTYTQLTIETATNSQIWMNVVGAPANTKYARMAHESGVFSLGFYSDNLGLATFPIQIARSTHLTTAMTLSAQAMALRPDTNVSITSVLGTEASLYFYGNTFSNKGIVIYNMSSVREGGIVSYNLGMYIDSDIILFRNSAGAVGYGNITNGVLSTTSGLKGGTAGLVHSDSVQNASAIYPTINQISYSSNSHLFAVPQGGGTQMSLSSTGVLTLPKATGEICIGGVSGAGIRIFQSGGAGYFDIMPAGAATYWRQFNGTLLMTMYSDGAIVPNGGVVLPNGSASAPAIRFANSGDSGTYMNIASGCIEFGAQFNQTPNRGTMRCFYNIGGKIDFMVAGGIPLLLQVDRAMPNGDAGAYLGDGAHRWNQIYSYYGSIATSDIREKQVQGSIPDALDLVENIEPIIASFNTDAEHRLFPMFSAQDVLDKLDNKLGTKIVSLENPDSLGMFNERMIPVLWQAVRVLLTRVKALEAI